MSTMKNHLAEVHKRLAKHHGAMAGHYQNLADCMAKASNDEAANAKGSLEALSGEHSAMVEFHDSCAAKCAKAAADEMNKLVPSNVSGIVPDLPDGIRRVPRAGQPLVPERPNVPLEFEKMFSIDDGE